jgi:capsular exopolysaccharide synthesis family protein
VELREYIAVLRKGGMLILLLALVGAGAASVYSLVKKPEFTASTQVFVSTQSSGTVADLAQGSAFTQQRVKTYADLVTTPIVLLPVATSLHLQMTADDVAKLVTADAPLDTTLISISVTSTDPVQAADIANATSESLTNVVRQIESTSEGNSSQVKLTRVKEAEVPSSPVSPNVPLNVALGLLIGLAMGVGVAALRHTLDTRVRNEQDVEHIYSAPIVGGIAYDPKAAQRPLIVHADPRSPRAESFRTLRTNLQYLDVEGSARTFVITSSVESEGKSTTTANLAIALESAGNRVIVVDADLRRPKLAEYMGLEGAVGLTDLLIGRAQIVDVAQRWGRGNLFVLPAGHIPPNPSELLGSRPMAELITRLENDFDYVLFDAPPLLPVTDAAILAKRASGAIVVVAAGQTHKSQLAGAVSALLNVGATISGFVMTMMPTKGPDAYGYGRYGYASGYGYAQSKPTKQTRKRRTRASRAAAR